MSLPNNQHGGDLACRVIFFIETAITGISALLCFFAPRFFINQFLRKQDKAFGDGKDRQRGEDWDRVRIEGAVSEALVQWYAVVLTGLVYAELRILISFDQTGLAYLMEGLVLGDVLHLAASFSMARACKGWTPPNIVGVVLTLIFLGFRIYFLAINYGYGVISGKGVPWYPSA